jgi:hypothetical protein
MKKYLFHFGAVLFLLLFSNSAFAQPFTPIHTGLIASFGTWTYASTSQRTGDATQGDCVNLSAASANIITPVMDFTTCGSTPYLTFKFMRQGNNDARATISIEVSISGGAWTNIGSIAPTGAGWFILNPIDVSAYSANNNVRFRFSSTALASGTRYPVIDDIQIYCATPPANDDCAGAISLIQGGVSSCTPTAGTLNYATQSVPITTCGGSGNDVWYSFTATATNAVVQVTGSADVDAVVELLSGTCGSLTSLQCEDNTFSGGTESLTYSGLSIGTTYYVRIHNYSSAPPVDDSFTICVYESAGGVASNCGNPTPITCGGSLAGQSNIGAGNDENSWSCSSLTTDGEDYFYSITATDDGTIRVTFDNVSGTATYLEVFLVADNGVDCAAGTCLQSAQMTLSTQQFTTGLNSHDFSVTAGDYFIVVDAQGSSSTLNWDISANCFATGILLDTINGCGTPADQGIYTTWDGAPAPATYDASLGGSYTVCETIYLRNPGWEWLKTYDISIGSCWTNISNPTPNGVDNGFHSLDDAACSALLGIGPTGNWTGTVTGNVINWSFLHPLRFISGTGCINTSTYGDGNLLPPPYTCAAYTFCFDADIDVNCSDFNGLQNIVSATDDGIGGSGSTSASNILITYPWSQNVSTLPVTLINFRAACASDQTSLYWATASEINNDYFTVERSFDGVNFEEIYRIPGAANSNSIQGYRVFDNIFPQVVYYRLSQTDFNGETIILKTIPANCNDAFDFDAIVYNDCANGFVAVQFTSIIGYGYNINVTDIQGRSVYNSNLKAEASNAEFIIPVAELNKGIYTLTITSKDASHTEKFFIE